MAVSLIGHDEAVAGFREAALTDRLHHAWLLAGPEGVGKARFAGEAALWLLARAAGPAPQGDRFEVAPDHRIASLINAGSHPDFRRLERLTKDKSEERVRSISVDQVRGLQPLFATTPSLSPRRVVLVDAIDDMERAAANALLKNLEEPPAGTIFLLVSHAPGRLLPTIRSRCRLLRFGPLSDPQVEAILRRELPHAGVEIPALTRVAEGAPGQGIRFAGLDVAGLDAQIERLATQGDPTNAMRATLAKQLGLKAAQPRYEAFLERAPRRIAQAARAGGAGMAPAIALWEKARRIAEIAVPQSLDPQLTVFELAGLVASLAPGAASAKG